ncbi:hypothetical protein F4803DRAFT_205021 [Xylaria telfairii]|nr:hypothetical protein F4803DRAFT_205021 [Xylaria telfairii]
MDLLHNAWSTIRNREPSRQEPQRYHFTIDEINERFNTLCIPPTQPLSRGSRISQKVIREIQALLRLLDNRRNRYDDAQWTLIPRIYAILHSIRAVELMDDFIRENYTDFHLPFNEQTLPPFISQKEGSLNLRQAFFEIQDYYLTDVKDIESKESIHLTLPDSGDAYFISERPLGHGSYGGVDLVFSRLSTAMFARKRVLRVRGSEQSQKYLVQELRELKELKHRHLVQIIGSYTDPQYIAYLMTPVADRTLEHFLNTSQPLKSSDKDVLRPFYGCLAGAMNYLYAHHIRHRDLTARNILIGPACRVYICDFGSSYNWKSRPSSKTKHRNVPTSPDYMAPEVAKGDERGTKSDMWSLGIVFLEMTTKLLDHRLSDLRTRIRHNASKYKFQPYAYANIDVVIAWMKALGNTNTDYEHDREPLSWISDLLQVRHEDRPTPPQLVRYMLESHSLHAFSCLDCANDIQSEASAYGLTEATTDAKVDSQRTRQEVEEVFASNSFRMDSGGMSQERTTSIEKWIENSEPIDPPAVRVPPTTLSHNPRDFDEDQKFGSIPTDQFLYSTYEYEFYSPTHATGYPDQTSSNTEPVELLGDIAWPEDQPDSSPVKPKFEKQEKIFRDTDLGFLEYVSNSSCDGEPALPFEECSDRSSIQSEEISSIQILRNPLDTPFSEHEPDGELKGKFIELDESSKLLFDEEEDKSDCENPWDEVSDRSESVDDSQRNTQDSIGMPTLADFKHELDACESKKSPKGEQEQENLNPVPPDTATGLPMPNKENELTIDSVDTTLLRDNQDPSRKSQSNTGKAKKVKHIKDKQRMRNNRRPAPIIPKIVIEPVYNAKREEPLSFKGSLPSINKSKRLPIIPRKRDTLLPVDVGKLMDNTWEMASSAPTSIMSEESKSKISRFFFMIPNDEEVEKLLSFYCQKGSASAVRTILQKASKAKSPKKRRYFIPLLHAVRGASSRHNKCVRELLAAGVDPNLQTRRTGQTPLHIAVMHSNFKGYTNLIWLLLSSNANPNIRDRSDEYPLAKLFIGADTGPLEPYKRGALTLLLKERALPNFTISGTGNTPLHLAVRRQDKISVAMLLHKGAQVDAKTTGGTTPLILTANQFRGDLSADHAEVLEHLLQSGASVNERAGVQGRTALHCAIIAGCAQAVVRLLEAGADVHLQDYDGCDAMWLAIKSAAKLTAKAEKRKLEDHVEIMLSLEKAARYKWKLKKGECAIETACKSKDKDMLRQLLKMGLHPDTKVRHGTVSDFAKFST